VVGVNVPVLHPPHEVDAALVVRQHVGKVATLVPIVVPFGTTEFGARPGGQGVERTDEVVGAHPHVVGASIGGGAFVERIVQHGSCFRGTVSIEHFLDADRA